MDPHPSTWRGRSEQISLDQVGCEARTIPAEGDVFFLDFSFYRTYQALCILSGVVHKAVLRARMIDCESLQRVAVAHRLQKIHGLDFRSHVLAERNCRR